MAVSIPADARLLALEDVATQLRVDSVRATTAAGSGHPTSCASAADLVAAIFFDVMRFDPQAPRDPACDRFVLSKGHAAPLLYAAWAVVGVVPREALDGKTRHWSNLARGYMAEARGLFARGRRSAQDTAARIEGRA